jgi:hypothetical protein
MHKCNWDLKWALVSLDIKAGFNIHGLGQVRLLNPAITQSTNPKHKIEALDNPKSNPATSPPMKKNTRNWTLTRMTYLTKTTALQGNRTLNRNCFYF